MFDSSLNNLVREEKREVLANLSLECYNNVNETYSKILEGSSGDFEENDEDPWCPRTFDGYACWDAAPPATTAYQSCPEYIIGFDPQKLAYKRCTEKGSWFFPADGKGPWNNYTTCVDLEDLNFRNILQIIYVVGYALSVVALILALVIFLYFKSLSCLRVRIHIHLFTSLTLNNFMWLIRYKSVVFIFQDNQVWCQILHLVAIYFMLSSYMWMFSEALHLFFAVVVIFIRWENVISIRSYIVIGWVMPLIITAVYGVTRIYILEDIERCWMDNSRSIWIINIPVYLTLLASLAFLVKIVRVLVRRFPGAYNKTPPGTKNATRVIFILIPLFGLHYILIPMHPLTGSDGHMVYQVVSAILSSLHGVCVAILFCFTNNEVLNVMRLRRNRLLHDSDIIPMTGIRTVAQNVA